MNKLNIKEFKMKKTIKIYIVNYFDGMNLVGYSIFSSKEEAIKNIEEARKEDEEYEIYDSDFSLEEKEIEIEC
jgi:hypothetical protein